MKSAKVIAKAKTNMAKLDQKAQSNQSMLHNIKEQGRVEVD